MGWFYMGGQTNTDLILYTKLHRPPVDRNHVHRQRLLDRLNQHPHRPLTLVSAPAGYGKSALISSWMEMSENTGAWISLSESDGDIRTFIRYVIEAVHKHFPKTCQNTQALLKNLDLPSIESLGICLLNE